MSRVDLWIFDKVVLNFVAVPEIFSGSKWRTSDFSWGSKLGILEFLCVKTRVYGSNASPETVMRNLLAGDILKIINSTKRQKFRLVQIQSTCRQQNSWDKRRKIKFVLGMLETILEKGENAGYQHFPPFPRMFSKSSFFRVVKSWDCVVKS